jgi:hypothetical protein
MPMKKVFIGAFAGVFVVSNINAQDINSVKKLLLLQKYKEAKEEVDKVVANPKFNTKPEAWLIKSSVYNGLANVSGSVKADSATYRNEAASALKKASEIDPTNALVAEGKEYVDVPRQLYVAYFNNGISKFNAKEWDGSYADLKSAAAMSDYLIKSKILNGPIDTNAVLYAGAAAQNAKKDEEAITWYTKLADAKVAGKDNEFLYQYTTDYYLKKKDEANFKKWVQTGKALYPQSKYFEGVESDYARSSGDFNDIIKFNEAQLAANPNDYEKQYALGAEIFDHLYPRDTANTPKGDVISLEQKMVAAFTKASELKPEKGLPVALLGFNYVKQADALNAKIEGASTEIKNFNKNAKPDKAGKFPPVPKDLLTKKDALYTEYTAMLDKAIPYFEKAVDRFSKETDMKPMDKQFYKNASGSLIDIYTMKKNNAKGKPAEAAKYAALQKKWEGVYDGIK